VKRGEGAPRGERHKIIMIYYVLNNNQIVQEKGGGKEKCNEWERGRMIPSFGRGNKRVIPFS
jgi:hypothetical protein